SQHVYRYALYLSANQALAEDITAETFLRLWSSARDVQMSSVKAYLLAIARNLYLHDLRHRCRDRELDPSLPAIASLADETENREELTRVLEELQRLPEIDRTALLLRAEDGLSYDEIAGMLGISAGAAKVKVHRARLKLAQIFQRSAVET